MLHALQRLWATLAANRLSIVPSLNFLLDRGLRESAAAAEAAPAPTGKEASGRCGAPLMLGLRAAQDPVAGQGSVFLTP